MTDFQLKDGRNVTLEDCDLNAIGRVAMALSVGRARISICDIMEICSAHLLSDKHPSSEKRIRLIIYLIRSPPAPEEAHLFEVMSQTGNGGSILLVKILQIIANSNLEWLDRHTQVLELLQQGNRFSR